jgi:hypothetical protein
MSDPDPVPRLSPRLQMHGEVGSEFASLGVPEPRGPRLSMARWLPRIRWSDWCSAEADAEFEGREVSIFLGPWVVCASVGRRSS